MSNVNSKISHRLLAAFLALVMVFSILPCSTNVYAATPEHPNAVTITVVDDNGLPVKNATVAYTIDSVANGVGYISDSKATDEKGVVEVLPANDFVAGDLTIKATITADGYDAGEITEQAISSADQDFQGTIVSKIIKDVTISWNESLVYTGSAQALVSVTEIEGDTIEYEINGEPVDTPEKTDAGTYTVKVTVKRAGKEDLVESKDITISPKTLTIGVTANTVDYNGAAQGLVSAPTGIEIGDKVTWIVGDNAPENYTVDQSNINYVPVATNVGEYKVKLTVERNANFTVYNSEELIAKISATEINGLSAELVTDLVYNGSEQELVKKDEATGKYVGGLEEGDVVYYIVGTDANAVMASDAWIEWTESSKPVGKDAGEYTVRIKVIRTNYNDTEVELNPATVTIAKAAQSLEFADNILSEVTLGANNEYNFAATGENLSGNDIEYSLVDKTTENVATITANGKVTVENAGIVTVKAFRAGSDNYLDAVVYNTIIVKNASTELVTFDSDSENYVLDEKGVVSEKTANIAHSNDNGNLSYSIDKNNIGLDWDSSSGKITVDKVQMLVKAMALNNGFVEINVTVKKSEGKVKGVKWIFEPDNGWKSQETNAEIFAADSDTYKILIAFAESPSFEEVCEITDPDSNSKSDWYNAEHPAIIAPLNATKYTIALDEVRWNSFAGSVTIEDQGTDTHYVYLKDKTTGQVSAPIAVKVNVDTTKPEANRIKIEYSKSPMDEFLEVITLGFYNPSVTVRLTAYDATSGIDFFTWNYTKEDGVSSINHPESVKGQKVPAEKDATNSTKYTAEFTITADKANQYRGHLTVTATDRANNTSEPKEDNDNVFVVDTISPKMSIKYAGTEPYTSQIDAIDTVHYFNGDVAVELTITEANFYSEDVEDVEVVVTKDGQTYDYGNVTWGTRDAQDQTVGTFTLSGDGDYVVTVNAKDKSGNPMASYTSETITVDKTAPVIDSVYNKKAQNITITINEHNFRASDIIVDVEARDIKGNPVSVNGIQEYVQNAANWNDNGDIHTLVLESTGESKILVDAIYKLTINYMDVSDNPLEQPEVTESSLIDHTAPTNVSIEIVTDPIDTFFNVITFGYYNPSVKIKFTAYDEEAGVKSFKWNYTKENGASDINRATDVKETEVLADQVPGELNKFTATVTLPDTDAKQLCGHLAVYAVDTYGNGKNGENKVTDDGNIIVVDTIAPEVSVEYSKSSRDVDGKAYYNGDVEATITVKEANFFASDVVVKVSKNGDVATAVTPTWTTDKNNGDIHYGKFTLTDDGHYAVSVEYTDKSDNFDEQKSAYSSHEITIDTVNPVIKVEYQNKDVIEKLTDRNGNDRKYFADTQTAVVTVTEHNFVESEVDFTILAKDVTGAELDASSLNTRTAWSHEGDVHTITITYPGDANYTFDVKYTDLATNEAADYATDYFTVDKTDPTNLTVSYSTSVLDTVLESVTFGFYNAKMTVTLTAEDPTSEVHSFLYSYLNASGVSSVNAEIINEAINAADIEYSNDRKTATVTFEIPKMVLGNDNQFNGTVEFTATDRAGNETETHKETKRIVVDNIAPTAQVSYNEATNVVGDISYFNGNINATVTINEANFYANDVQVMVSKDGGAATAVTPTWRNNSIDVHVGTFTLTEDGDYIVTINYTDKSSNKMTTYTSKQMTIDTKIEEPTYTINDAPKTEVGGAYKGDVTIGFSFNDQNFDTKTITLTRTRFDKVEDVTDTFVKVTDNDKGGSGSFTIPSEAGNDGIYVLTIGITDKAQHTKESKVKFTINRFGSVYEYSDELVGLIKDGGQYITSVDNDLVITEYNADRILEGSLKILITRDGETVDVNFTSDPKDINAQVDIGESGWYQYVYTIKASNFEQDGVYKISLSSEYAADDSEKNESSSVPENSIDETGKGILDTMSFTVDSLAPEIRNIVNLDKAIVNAQTLDIKYTVVDVGGLKSIEVVLNGKTIDTITEFSESAFNYSGQFTINESSDAQTVQIKVIDLAGNVTDTAAEDFSTGDLYIFNDTITVSTNIFVRWYANKPLFWGSIGGVVVLAGAICFIIAAKRKKKEESK